MNAQVSQIIYQLSFLFLLILINTSVTDVMFLNSFQPDAETNSYCPSTMLDSEDSEEGKSYKVRIKHRDTSLMALNLNWFVSLHQKPFKRSRQS